MASLKQAVTSGVARQKTVYLNNGNMKTWRLQRRKGGGAAQRRYLWRRSAAIANMLTGWRR
jgi:hypothetical protein